MSDGSKPEIFHSDDINEVYLDHPGKPVAINSLHTPSNVFRSISSTSIASTPFIDFRQHQKIQHLKGSSSHQEFQSNHSSDLNNSNSSKDFDTEHETNYYAAPASGLERAATNDSRSHGTPPKMYNFVQRWRYAFREPLAEFFGTMVLVMFGDGVVAQVKLSSGASGNYTQIAFCWATAVFLGYQCSAGISGGHLNPAVTLSAAVFRKFPWRKVPGYIFSQFFGGFIGAFLVYGVYLQAFNDYEGPGIRTVTGDHASAGVFCTFPQEFLSTKGQVTSEVVATALLQFGIFSMTDPYNAPLGSSFPFGLFVLIYGLGSAYGYLTGYALNLARDFGPRLAAAAIGYPSEMFSYGNYYFWVPIVAPILGALLGAFLYDLFLYQGLDSPLNQPDFGWSERVKHIKEFKLSDMKPDFDIERGELANQQN
ncbi:hypothetical protein WICMUC_004515 [Wickerhamomyces mucosus]|uniref:Aquaporin n=1 Tax=Wickerhamomyces mucosus TaxID=1378264 RepID=A0A9P8PGV4_9ASCO|nr:hypothetical protein WICMUC_004515 [Wickerhamomyces mucosus]